MHLDPAAWALLAPRPLSRLNCRHLRLLLLLLRSNARIAGCVGLLHRALGVNTTARISSLTTDRAQILNRLRNDGDRLENAHGAPIAKCPVHTGKRSCNANIHCNRSRPLCSSCQSTHRLKVPCFVKDSPLFPLVKGNRRQFAAPRDKLGNEMSPSGSEFHSGS